ncbi:arylsulfatase regulator [Vibrio kanaloae]|uniref:arylsulfatase regulator n=1 Tax=Vibrio TaxID=662 RepID=UPI0010BE3F21|nr:arylsulfatase regulator [Vibrio kanaloae]TKE99807.1 arylsulfatase regulator [Vibrio kanaloae]TKF16229.1 arylsulfatase regulator [Vibrio kanaloae]HBC3404714.1 arylsulfatase regulator [Vibrio parahaemolyticus]
MNDLTLEQLQLTRIVDDYANQFPLTEDGDALLLEGCYDYMEAFKYVMDSTSRVQMDYICQQYLGFYRFAKWMELLAEGISDGRIKIPKDH